MLRNYEVHFINLFALLILNKANLNLAQLSDLDSMKEDWGIAVGYFFIMHLLNFIFWLLFILFHLKYLQVFLAAR